MKTQTKIHLASIPCILLIALGIYCHWYRVYELPDEGEWAEFISLYLITGQCLAYAGAFGMIFVLVFSLSPCKWGDE